MPDTLIGPTTGPCPYGMNISMLDGDIRPIRSFQIHIWNFNAKGIQLRTGACLAKRKPREPAVEIAAQRNKSGQPVLLGECAGATLNRDQKPD